MRTLLTRDLGGSDAQEDDLNREAKKVRFEDYASLVICILSHGIKGHVYGVDWEPVLINELMYRFNDGNFEALEGKPKIFIVLACQGSNNQLASVNKIFGEQQNNMTLNANLEEMTAVTMSTKKPRDPKYAPFNNFLKLAIAEEFIAYTRE